MTAVRLARLGALALAVLVSPAVAGEGEPPPTEYQVKAGFLYSFAKFVQWPDDAFHDAGEPFVVGVLGTDPFGPVLEQVLEGKTALNRPVVIKRFSRVEEVQAQILFVGSSAVADLPRILQALRGRAILIAGESEGFAQSGGMVGFKVQEHRVRFEINLRRAEEGRLKISSQLLKLAIIVSTRS